MSDKNSAGIFNKFSSSVSDCSSFCYNKSKEITVNSSRSAALWCVLKLLNASKSVENITNARSETKRLAPEKTESKTSAKLKDQSSTNLKQQKSRKHLNKVNQGLSPTLEVPLQERAEENSSSDRTVISKTGKVSTKKKNKIQADLPKKEDQQKTDVDTLGFSFFPPKSRLKSSRPENLNSKKVTNTKKFSPEEPSSIDNIGFSFVPVKAIKSARNPGKESLNETRPNHKKICDDKPVKERQSSANKTSEIASINVLKPVKEPPCIKKFIDTLGKPDEYVVVNAINKSRPCHNHIDLTNKINNTPPQVTESRKVHASISYAQVASQNTKGEQTNLNNSEINHHINGRTNNEEINLEVGSYLKTHNVDIYPGVNDKVQLFENASLAPLQSKQDNKLQSPELSRLHKILLTESELLKKGQSIDYLAISTEIEKPQGTETDNLAIQNIEASRKELNNSCNSIHELLRSERTEVVSTHNFTNDTNTEKVVNKKSTSVKLSDNALVHLKGDSIQALNELESEVNFQPNKLNSIQELLEKEQSYDVYNKKEVQKLTPLCFEEDSVPDRVAEPPLVLEKTFEIFENNLPKIIENTNENNFHLIQRHTHTAESNLHLIERQSEIDESFNKTNQTVCQSEYDAPSIIETCTIIESSPLIEASTIIETFPNLGSSPVVETSTVVTSNTGLAPNLEAVTIIESFPLKKNFTVLETSTVIVTTSSETQNNPILFETSATIEALPPSHTQSLLEAITVVETPSPSNASIDIVTSSIVESLPEEDGSSDTHITAIEQTALKDIQLKSVSSSKSTRIKDKFECEEIGNKRIKMTPNTQVRILTLNDNENQESALYRLEKNWILEFRLGPSLLGRKVNLYCNYPEEVNGVLQHFDRTKYQLVHWIQDEGCQDSDDTALEAQIELKVAGSFHYYFEYDTPDSSSMIRGCGYFLVNPLLSYGEEEELPLDCIQCQTIISKGLGIFDLWESKLMVSRESGYNMIHFTPIQELGVSNSAYSISEQNKLNPIFGENVTLDDVKELMSKIRKEWKVTSICDIVLNHTANESKWIHDHPEATYNCANCPYMRPAYLLDAALHQFTKDVKNGLYEIKGIPLEINSEEHLEAIRYHLHKYLSELNIAELFMCDVNNCIAEFLSSARKVSPVPQNKSEVREIKLIQDPEYKRLSSFIDLNLALSLYNTYRPDCFDEEHRLKRCAEDLKCKLDHLNKSIAHKVYDQLKEAVENCVATIRYHRVQHDGPKIKDISTKHPLIPRYFTDYLEPTTLKEHESVMYSVNSKYLMAHNGWVINADPLNNFAAPGSEVYIRRQLIAWGDSVKLRYGDKPQDSPFLWNHMKTYVEETAKIFDGVRLDNCHSTPIHVAEYLLDCARKVRPDLYVVAELFTNSDHTDNIFVNKLGITSLIREAMAAWDSHEQGRLVYRYGGYPVGSFYQPNVRPLVPSIAHALFLDATHDNPSPVEKRSVFDMLPSTALVNMACCASGSNRGYDELVPHHIHVVDETREYTEWINDDIKVREDARYVNKGCGIIAVKKAINDLHYKLGVNGFSQVYVDQMDADIVAVTRHSPITHESYILVAFTAFQHPSEDMSNYQRGIKPLRVAGALDEIVLEATLNHTSYRLSGSKYAKVEKFEEDSNYINGYVEYEVDLKQNIQLSESSTLEKVDSGVHNTIQLNFKSFQPGSIVIIKTSLPEDMTESVENVRNVVKDFSLNKETELVKIINNMTLTDLNRALYRCDQEERDEGYGFDVYNIPNFGPVVYAGLQGFMSLLANIRPNNDLGHPMCCNLRDGNWMIDYIWQRLKLDKGTQELGQWIEENTKSLKCIPRYLIPCYLDVIITGIYVLLLEQSYKLMSSFINNGSTFVKALALGSIQCAAYIKSSNLPELSPNISEPKPPKITTVDGKQIQSCVSLAAGLPHFSVGYMRNWGRDTFIAFRGLLLLTGRFQDARYHILAYGQCLRHGLIPNLLDGGNNPRYNCRDAVWWWLHSIKAYVEEAPNGIEILRETVSRIFPTDDSPAQPIGTVEQHLCDVMQEALTVHFQGLTFRERNAGHQIDQHMTDKGFNNQIGVHPETGFIFGGNEANCGTWMDKMGSSDKAGNRGKPATPRDGSAIELIGLSKSVITWLDKLSKDNHYPYDGVQRVHKHGSTTKWTFKQWSERIQANFSKYFWVNTSPSADEIRPDLINKRGIYKDCYGASQEWTDYQLRCNFPIAMVIAPELFNPQHAWIALKKAEKYLLGHLGMKTLDPEDWAYNGYYDNSNDSDNSNIANGFNYHQGPEWVWPLGFYLRAKLAFAEQNQALRETLAQVKVILSKHYVELHTSPWRGLPELTNENGSYCQDSAKTQAWSMSCILEVLDDLQKIERRHVI